MPRGLAPRIIYSLIIMREGALYSLPRELVSYVKASATACSEVLEKD